MDFQSNPIRKLERIGNWDRNHGFRPRDRKLLTSPRAIQKIEDAWKKSPAIFDIYLINTPKTNKTEYREVGPVDINNFSELENIDFADDAVNIVFTNNVGAEGVPLTGWIMAHRFAHSLRYKAPYLASPSWEDTIKPIEKHLDRIIITFNMPNRYPYAFSSYEREPGGYGSPYGYEKRVAYDRYRKALAEQLGTSRAARTRNLRNHYEWYYELVAQYIITGKIRFRKLSNVVDFGPAHFGRRLTRYKDDLVIESLNEEGDYLAEELEYRISDLIESSIGKVFLM